MDADREQEAVQLARDLGCGWRVERITGVVLFSMTVIEAQRLRDRIQSLEDQITELEKYGPHDES